MIEEMEGNVPIEVTRVPKRRRGAGLGAEFDVAFGSASTSTLGTLFSVECEEGSGCGVISWERGGVGSRAAGHGEDWRGGERG